MPTRTPRTTRANACLSAPGILALTSKWTLVTVNLLLGIRATTLRYQPGAERVIALLGSGRPLRSRDVAVLGDRN